MTSAADPRPRLRRPSWVGRNYSLLTAAAFVTNLGSHGALIAAAFAVLENGGDGGDVGLVAAARTLPLVLFLLIGGAIADRLPRHRVMVAANALNCLSQAAFAALVLTGEPRLWQMMLLTALGGTGQAFFSPAAEGMLMSSVQGEQVGRAFAVFRMAMQGAGVGGAALGGAMVAVIGPGWVLAADAAAFAVAGSLRAFLDVGHIPAREQGGGLLADLREGWREFSGRPWLWGIVLQFSIANAVVGAADAVYGPLVARDHLGGAGPWGLALGFFGAGTVAGALLMTRWKPRRLLFVGTLCVFPLALPSAALAVPVPVGLLCAVMFLTGITLEVFGVSWMTALHQEIPEDKLSRVSAYDWFGSVALVPLAMALAGPSESLFGRTASLWGCAVLVVVVTAAVLCVPDVRNLTRRTKPVAGHPAVAAPAGTRTEPATTAAVSPPPPQAAPATTKPDGGRGTLG
ncbi:MFS transporter [Streptomyces phaeoluteigriseus]|uniref:MFS transporter n=1 Tax=Streptomyces phaeoluteigriseus TaxID=114686 RepID=UPI000B8CE199|nr:MFS transporter [Streptomyces phaeoluteigriseus]